MHSPQPLLTRRDQWARSAAAWALCSLAGLPVLLGLGFALFQVGIGLWGDKLAVLLMTVPAIAATNSWIIAREESYLFRKFGAEYERYLATARRWM